MVVSGIENCKFINKEGKEVSFCRVTLLYDVPDDRGTGRAADVVNVGPEKVSGIEVGDTVEVLYNKFGKVSRFEYITH